MCLFEATELKDVSVGRDGMTAGQYKDPKLALALMELFRRPYELQNCVLDPRLEKSPESSLKRGLVRAGGPLYWIMA